MSLSGWWVIFIPLTLPWENYSPHVSVYVMTLYALVPLDCGSATYPAIRVEVVAEEDFAGDPQRPEEDLSCCYRAFLRI